MLLIMYVNNVQGPFRFNSLATSPPYNELQFIIRAIRASKSKITLIPFPDGSVSCTNRKYGSKTMNPIYRTIFRDILGPELHGVEDRHPSSKQVGDPNPEMRRIQGRFPAQNPVLELRFSKQRVSASSRRIRECFGMLETTDSDVTFLNHMKFMRLAAGRYRGWGGDCLNDSVVKPLRIAGLPRHGFGG